MSKYVWQVKDRNSNLWVENSSSCADQLVEQEDAQVYLSEKSAKKAIRDIKRKEQMYRRWKEEWKKDPENWGGGNRPDPYPGYEFRNKITGHTMYFKEVSLIPVRYRLVEDDAKF